MGDSQKITLSSDETSAEAPDAPQVRGIDIGADAVSVSTEPEDEETVEVPVEAERPSWLPEKFESAEAMAEAYAALEGKMGAPDAEEAPASTDEASTGLSPDALQPFYDEYADSGDLTAESYTALEGMGLSKDLVQAFMVGQQAAHEAEMAKIYASVGGEEAYKSALDWAKASLSAEEIAAYNTQVESGDYATALLTTQGLIARHQQSAGLAGHQPQLLKSEPVGPGGAAPYESLQQVLVDMKTPEYKTDPAFRKAVKARVARSNVM